MSEQRITEILELNHIVIPAATTAQALTTLNHHLGHQITIEVVLTATGVPHVPGAGTMQIAYKPKGASAYQDFVGTQDLTGAPLTIGKDGVFDSLRFTPANLDADCSYIIRYAGVWWPSASGWFA